MDIFTFMIAIVMMMLAVQFEQNWLVLGIAAVLIITTRSPSVTAIMIISAAVLYFFSESMKELWPVIVFGLVILAVILGVGKNSGQQQDPFGGMGMDMGMGMPPMGGMY